MSHPLTIQILPCQSLHLEWQASQFTYLCDADAPKIGQICLVPFGRNDLLGICVSHAKPVEAKPKFTLKPIKEILSLPALLHTHIDFIKKFSDYNMISPGAVLKMMIAPATNATQNYETFYQLQVKHDDSSIKMTKLRQNFIEQAKNLPPLPLKLLAEETRVSANSIKKMVELKMVTTITQKENLNIALPDIHHNPPILSDEQQIAWHRMQQHLTENEVILLDGETGSGKTALYFEAVAKTLEAGKQVLILLPEIALTRQFVHHFKARFGQPPLLWHSAQTPAQKRAIWKKAIHKAPCCFMGARSGLLLPFKNLGLIIIDEEHDSSYKQHEGHIYHARDMAVLRAKIDNISIILASATPSLETIVNTEKGRYQKVRLQHRYGGATMPDVQLIDLRKQIHQKGKFISTPIIEQLSKGLNEKKQSILFLNRRGFAPLLLCRSCGYRFMCDYCDAWLVEHRKTNHLECHHCGHKANLPTTCPHCSGDDLLPCGPGIERIAEETRELFPDANIQLMSSDHIKKQNETEKLITAMQHGEIDILIGTQILTKGYHFSNLSFVGVIDADLSLAGGDLRAGERTYQLLYQVMGRAGREQHGTVMLQTTHPEHILFQSLTHYDRDAFYDAEKKIRMQDEWPPFGRMAMLILKAKNQENLTLFANQLKKSLPKANNITVLGPALAPLARVNNQWQIRFLLRCKRNFQLQQFIADWIKKVKKPSNISLKIDIDPL